MPEGSLATPMPPAELAAPSHQAKSAPAPVWLVEVDRTTRAEWSCLLDLFDDANIYQTFPYGSVRWGEKNLSHLILKRDGEVMAMAQLRIICPTPLKFGMAYLRWGPIYERRGAPPDPEILKRMAASLVDEYVKKRKLFLSVLPNAFAGSPRAQAFQSAFSGFVREPLTASNTYRTFLLDLAPSIDDLRSALDKKWRNQLTRSEKNNLEVISGNTENDYRAFCAIYDQMLKRKSFDTSVDTQEFARIQQALPDNQRMRILICKDQGRPVAGLVVSAFGDSAIYLLGATSDDGLNSKGAYLLQWTMIKWLKSQGIRWYDLGGIDPEVNPGVYHFKRGFSGADVSQINPLSACDSAISSAIVKLGLAAQRFLRAAKASVKPRATKPSAAPAPPDAAKEPS